MIYAIHGKGGPGSGNAKWASYYQDAPAIANSWRMGGDIEGPMRPSWAGILRLIDSEVADKTTGISGPNSWNDCDMMVVGQGLSATEDRAHVSMWAMLASPMIVGYDLRNTSAATIAALIHPAIVKISQDPLGKQATLVPPASAATTQVWRRPLAGGGVAVALLNRGEAAAKISFTLAEVGWAGSSAKVSDVWSGGEVTAAEKYGLTVGAHAAEVLVLSE